ncbi:Hypothetical_protein [Hexamita inflata]|uniref:Hypothetical_protein n=1 Tax=Hexamita inflata TaxID=28002 RepID=A0AA86RJL7_9EUKA|nr:Hypothetical protein HINF_LOCUS65472 [Hexamita inflata]
MDQQQNQTPTKPSTSPNTLKPIPNSSQNNSEFLNGELINTLSSDGTPINFKCKNKQIFTRAQYKQRMVNALLSFVANDPEKVKQIAQFNDQQICEVIDSIGKHFWTAVSLLNPDISVVEFKHYYLSNFKGK